MNKKTIDIVMKLLYEFYPDAKCELDHTSDFQLLVATVLSAQTTDVSVNKVTPLLFHRYPTAVELASGDLAEVQEIIKSIGLYKTKANNIINLSRSIITNFKGIIPQTIEELIMLPGVGRKTANVVVSNAFNVPAIAVDTHVFRVSNRIGIVKAKDVVETENLLMKGIPKKDWIKAHHTFIFHGRYTCHSKNPKCDSCCVGLYCEYRRSK